MAHLGDSGAPDGIGILPLQDYSTPGAEIDKYNVVGVSITGRDAKYGDYFYDGTKVGAIRQSVFWPRSDGRMGWYAWFYTVGILGGGSRATARDNANNLGALTVQPKRSTTLLSEKLGPRSVEIPASWPEIPANFNGAVGAYATENSEQIAYHHTDPRMVSANRGSVATGSIVGDVAGNSFDDKMTARLQSLTRVINKPSNAPGNTLGIHMGPSAQGDTRGGYVIDWATARKTRPVTTPGTGPFAGVHGLIGGNGRTGTAGIAGESSRLTFNDMIPTFTNAGGYQSFNTGLQLYNPNTQAMPPLMSAYQTSLAYNPTAWKNFGGFGSPGGGGAGNSSGLSIFSPWSASNFAGQGAYQTGGSAWSGTNPANQHMKGGGWILGPQRALTGGAGGGVLGFFHGGGGTGGKTSQKVLKFGPDHKGGNTLAWFKREGAERAASGGAIAMLSSKDGGIIDVGLNNDPHRIGFDGDGNPINPSHLSARALWINPEATNEDGPMKFESTFKRGKDLPIKAAVHLAWDGARFAWWSTSAVDAPGPPSVPSEPGDPGDPPIPPPDIPEDEPTHTPRRRPDMNPPNPVPGPSNPTSPTGPGTPGGGPVGGIGGGGGGHGNGMARGASAAIQTHAAAAGPMPRPWSPRSRVRADNRGKFRPTYDIASPKWGLVAERDLMGPAFSFMARLIQQGRTNSTYDFYGLTDAGRERMYDSSPVTGHFESFSKQIVGDFAYTQLPYNRTKKSRWRGGTADGGAIFLPPELDMGAAVNDQWDGLIDGGGISTATLVLGPNTCLGFGKPDLDTGGVTGTTMCHDDAGVVTITPPVGGSFPLDWGLRVLFAGTVAADTTTVSTGAAALLGNDFARLRISGKWNGGASDGNHLYVFFNGNTGTKVQITPVSWDIADDEESFEIELRPKSGTDRAIVMLRNIRYDGDGTFLSSRTNEVEVWANVADEITEIGLNTDDVDGIGAGSQFEVTGVRFL